MDKIMDSLLKFIIAGAAICAACLLTTEQIIVTKVHLTNSTTDRSNLRLLKEYPGAYDGFFTKSVKNSIQAYNVASKPHTNALLVNRVNVDFEKLGVIKQNGIRYTYYSSNVLRHYRIDEWLAGDDGLWRTTDGYIVVASKMHPKNAIIPTPFGNGKVLDYCETDGAVDIYVNF